MKYEIDYLFRVTVPVEADNKHEALEKAAEISFELTADNPSVSVEYVDGSQPEVYEGSE
jgi:hypothetical protein